MTIGEIWHHFDDEEKGYLLTIHANNPGIVGLLKTETVLNYVNEMFTLTSGCPCAACKLRDKINHHLK